jgi:hypothetical protein
MRAGRAPAGTRGRAHNHALRQSQHTVHMGRGRMPRTNSLAHHATAQLGR